MRGCPHSRAQRRAVIRGEGGSAVVEFSLVGVLVVALFLGLVQLGIALHVRTTLVACAADGARFAANADRSPDEGAARARELISQSLSPRFARDVSAGYEHVAGAPTIVVEVRTALPVIGLLGPDRSLVVRGHALEEGP
jgi:Flp pilus assembly protein TadG